MTYLSADTLDTLRDAYHDGGCIQKLAAQAGTTEAELCRLLHLPEWAIAAQPDPSKRRSSR